MTNGEKPHSKTLSHISSYPIVTDLIKTYNSNPYGQKSVNLANNAYDSFAKPVLPYFQGPFSWFAPYLSKADEFGETGLSKVDSTFPIIKEDTEKVKSTVLDYAFFPLRVAASGKDYVFTTYNDEYKKVGGQGYFTSAKAMISTELKVASDILHYGAEWLGPKKEQAKSQFEELKKKAEETQKS